MKTAVELAHLVILFALVSLQLPTPAGGWTGLWNATAFRSKCPQANNERELLELQQRIERGEDVEDCLHLNIYTPQASHY